MRIPRSGRELTSEVARMSQHALGRERTDQPLAFWALNRKLVRERLSVRLCGTATSPCSGDRTKSPAAVSGKREYSRIQPETFRSLATQNGETGVWRPKANAQKPAVGGLFCNSTAKFSNFRTAWLATQWDSNQSPCNFPANREFNRENCSFAAWTTGL